LKSCQLLLLELVAAYASWGLEQAAAALKESHLKSCQLLFLKLVAASASWGLLGVSSSSLEAGEQEAQVPQQWGSLPVLCLFVAAAHAIVLSLRRLHMSPVEEVRLCLFGSDTTCVKSWLQACDSSEGVVVYFVL
jgi:hypothetical protein